MIAIILTIVLIVLAGVCKAVADTLTHHYANSIFADKNPQFWNAEISWQNKWKNGDSTQGRKYNKMFDGFTDAWHIFNNSAFYLLIVAIAIAGCGFTITNILIIDVILKTIIGITIHMQTFNLFYTHIFVKKP